MARKKTDAEPPEEPSSGGSRLWLRVGFGLIVLAGVVAVSMAVRERVENRLEWAKRLAGFRFDALPSYVPEGFRGELAELEDLPNRVSLTSPSWRDSLEELMLRNPWVAAVRKIERVDDELVFSFRFRKPIVALRGRDGFLLVDSSGFVIDRQPGEVLADAWGVPACEPSSGLPDPVRPGTRLQTIEVHELLALVRELEEQHIYPKYLKRVPELVAVPESPAAESFMWTLVLDNGAQLVWGRSPGGIKESPLPSVHKAENFRYCIQTGVKPGARVSLCRREQPIIE